MLWFVVFFFFLICGNVAFHAKPGGFHAPVLPEDGILCKTAAIIRCVVKNKELVVASSMMRQCPGPEAARPGSRSQPSQTSLCSWISFLWIQRRVGRLKLFLLDLILTCSCTVARVQPQIWKLRSIQISHGCRYLLQSESVDKYRHKPQVLSEEHLVKVQSMSRYFILMHRMFSFRIIYSKI